MDAEMEAQVHRVLAAFQDAATRHWGSDQPLDSGNAAYRRANRKPAKPRPESPMRIAVRCYLTENPDARTVEVMQATGCNKNLPADMRRNMGLPAERPLATQKGLIMDAVRDNPGFSSAQIAGLTNSNPDYVAKVMRETRFARRG